MSAYRSADCDRMQLQEPTRRTAKDNELIPMINVVFLLLIFFMVAGTIKPPAPVDVKTPGSASNTVSQPERTLHIDKNGALWLGDKRSSLDDLATTLRNPAPTPDPALEALAVSDNRIALRADAALTIDQLRPIIDALRDAGVEQVELLTTAKPAATQ